MKKIVLAIEGMTCSACSNGLEKYLNKQEGIKNAVVNLVMANALIEYDEKVLNQQKIEEFVKKAPSDGMSGKTDEERLGFTYADLEKVARGKTDKMDPALVKTIKGRIKSMAFKKKLLNLPNFKPSTAK